MTEGQAGTDFNITRAELFESLGHPTRIQILQLLSQRPMTFSDLKKQLGIESSGHLSFHLGKLTHLVNTSSGGAYVLTEDGKEALRLMETIVKVETRETARRTTVRNPMNIRKTFASKATRKTVVLLTMGILVLALAISAISGTKFYTLQENLHIGNETLVVDGWSAVYLNDTQSKNIVSFQFFFPMVVVPNLTQNLIPIRIAVPHVDRTQLDSLKLEFLPRLCCPIDVWFKSPDTSGVYIPAQIYKENENVIVNIPNLGIQGVGTLTFDLLVQVYRTNLVNGNYSVGLDAQLALHDSSSQFIGHAYNGEAVVPLAIAPDGLVTFPY
jgi:DNA-binding transcriptional ArsR family regulator